MECRGSKEKKVKQCLSKHKKLAKTCETATKQSDAMIERVLARTGGSSSVAAPAAAAPAARTPIVSAATAVLGTTGTQQSRK